MLRIKPLPQHFPESFRDGNVLGTPGVFPDSPQVSVFTPIFRHLGEELRQGLVVGWNLDWGIVGVPLFLLLS